MYILFNKNYYEFETRARQAGRLVWRRKLIPSSERKAARHAPPLKLLITKEITESELIASGSAPGTRLWRENRLSIVQRARQ